MKLSPRCLRSLTGLIPLVAATAWPSYAQSTYTFGTGENQFSMAFVRIGDEGNLADTTGAPNPAGAVPYRFWMGKYEVSEDMINKAIAGGLTGVSMSPTRGPNKPATGMSWVEAARLVNWLNTSTGHQPAYSFDINGNFQLWSSAEAWQSGGENLYRHKDAYFVLPNDHEWYKAAFYDASAGVYYDYSTGSDTPPTPVAYGTDPGTAVYFTFESGPADITTAGGLSPYGTMGQGGNVWEWLESALDEGNDDPAEYRALRGGNWWYNEAMMASSFRHANLPQEGQEGDDFGFRVALVPEPWHSASVMGAVALGFGLWRRRGAR